MFGFINLNKPSGFTSHDCVAKLRRLLNTKRVGHGGTLDPAATGVLPIAVGKATRLLQFLPEPKAYRARIRLGVTTTTDDLEGEVIESVTPINLAAAQIIDRLNSFVGTIEQVPPIYSAIKQGGKKLYEYARKEQDVAIEPRTVTIDKVELLNIYQTDFYEIEVDINCSPGTYIRAIARDLGDKLGTGGTLANLIRTSSCGMQLDDSTTFEEIASQLQQQTFSLIKPSLVLGHLAAATLENDDARRWCQGQLVDLARSKTISHLTVLERGSYLVTYSTDGTFLGISILFERDNILKLKPKIVCM
ncbi:tRNA pseudouridine(55) synthase TruB [Pleurocapsales cyanobacterium LEGE 10410]|nr:tRNA pseudouridine(55) synthase TruB [Pleurocapsales cyanobacterium LEGE 10410]